jgi:hypothetical protein
VPLDLWESFLYFPISHAALHQERRNSTFFFFLLFVLLMGINIGYASSGPILIYWELSGRPPEGDNEASAAG